MARPLINISRKQALVFAGFLVLYEFLTYIANDMIMPGMITVVSSFHGPESAVATSMTAYILGGASLQLFLGPLSDRFGRRPVMLVGALFFFLCTTLIACTHSIDQFLAARFFQGMGLCFIGVIGYATLQEIFEEMDAIRLIAIMATVSILAPLLGPLLGALFISFFNWRLIFVGIGFFSLIALWGLWRFMPESIGKIKHNGEEIKRILLSPRTIVLNYKNLLVNPKFMFASLALGLLSSPCLAWIALAPIILTIEAKLSIIQYSFWQIPLFGAAIAGNWVLQKLTHRGSVKKIILLGSSILAVGLVLVLLLPLVISSNFIWLIPGLVIYFFALGITHAPLDRWILFSTQVAKGTTSALMTMISMCVQALGIEIAKILYALHSNIHFGFYCTVTALFYFIFLAGAFYAAKKSDEKINGI